MSEKLSAMDKMSISDTQWQAFIASRANPRVTFSGLGGREFRILALYPGEPTDPITCQIVKQDLDHIMQGYVALSYTWGDTSKTAAIRCFINDQKPAHLRSAGHEAGDLKAGELQVTENLVGALRRSRLRDEMTALWVDAICIDQENVDERSQQIGIMAEIYGRATKTMIWLGEASDDSDDGLALIEDLYAARQPSGVSIVLRTLPQALSKAHWTGLGNILRRAWFRRAWVRQELAVSRDPGIVCGQRTISWEKFQAVVPSLLDAQLASTDATEPRGGLHHTLMLKFLRALFWQHSANLILDKELLFLLSICRECESTDPRDKVFAVLGLCSPTQQSMLPKLDYSQTPETVFYTVALASIAMFGSLNILSHAGTSCSPNPSHASLPSWVPDWSVPWDVSVIDTPLPDHRYRAAGNTAPDPQVSMESKNLLGLIGKLVDAVSDVTEPPPSFDHLFGAQKSHLFNVDDLQFDIYRWARSLEALRLKCERHSSLSATTEALWRTLCANKAGLMPFGGVWQDLRQVSLDEHSLIAPREYAKSFEAWCAMNMADPHDVAAIHSVELFLLRENLNQWQAAMLRSAKNRRFGITMSGHMFLGPRDVVPGDLVCVLHGGDVPFVLRSRGGNRYCLVGECYAHGLMDGEAMKDDKLAIQEFVIE
jgi:heterokaryon incompatibility protein (HET)